MEDRVRLGSDSDSRPWVRSGLGRLSACAQGWGTPGSARPNQFALRPAQSAEPDGGRPRASSPETARFLFGRSVLVASVNTSVTKPYAVSQRKDLKRRCKKMHANARK